jgi:hypothetical protein
VQEVDVGLLRQTVPPASCTSAHGPSPHVLGPSHVPLDVLRTTSVTVTRSPLAYLVLLVAVDQARALSAQVGAAARLTPGAVVVVTAPGA